MKKLLFLLFAACISGSFAQSIHAYKAADINGNTVDFSQFKGKKILIVNTASECGYTPQYEELEQLYRKYKDQGLVVIGFPSNDFGAQEPGTEKEIAEFCRKNYGVTFLMMSKISVKGESRHEIYRFLTQKALNGVEDSEVKWNFQKYLVDEEGKLVRSVSPKVTPMSREITGWIAP